MPYAKPTLSRVVAAIALGAVAAGLLTAVLLELMVIIVAISANGAFDPPRGLMAEGSSFFTVWVTAGAINFVGLVLVSPFWFLAHRVGWRSPLAAMLFGAAFSTGAMLPLVGDLSVVATLIPVGPLIGLLIWRIAYGGAKSQPA